MSSTPFACVEYRARVKRFLLTPPGWLLFQVVVLVLALSALKLVLMAFPDLSARSRFALVVGMIVVAWVGSYLLRRRVLERHPSDGAGTDPNRSP